MDKVIRPSKNGGFSVCGSPDEKVGMGRCHHILSGESSVVLNYKEEEKCYYVDLKNNNENLSIVAKEETIKNFFEGLKEGVDEETKQKIMSFLSK